MQLAEHGYAAYEISNFARDGFRCRHNDSYWLYHDYIGIGAGASGKWDMADGGICRYSNIRSPEQYITRARTDGRAVHSDEVLDTAHAAAEAVWLGLRRTNGISLGNFAIRFGADIRSMFTSSLRPWLQTGYLELNEQQLCLTEKGQPLADAIASAVL
ncbi:MAG: coproporphyrinogen III oxidase, partial [Mariprofundaceae bacterium]|nr:coproporphyrinogen III oxidase [Mariprofundaceae bacterium]